MPSRSVGFIHTNGDKASGFGEGTAATVNNPVFHITVFPAAELFPNSAQGKMKTPCPAAIWSCSGDKVFHL